MTEAYDYLIKVRVRRPAGQAIGIKEDLAVYCERFGDARVISVTEAPPEQPEQFNLFNDYRRQDFR